MVGLETRRRDLVRTFSRGMQQRLAIGRAVLHDPDVMLFDEPYTGLDQDASSMLDEVLKTVAAQGTHRSDDIPRPGPRRRTGNPLRYPFARRDHGFAPPQKRLKKSNLLTFYKQALAG